MLLNKILSSFLLIVVLTGCYSLPQNQGRSANRISIQLNSELDDRTLSQLEQIMIDEMPDGINQVSIFTSPESYHTAVSLEQYFYKNYRLKPQIYQVNNITKLYIQLESYSDRPCYIYQLDDFNWYKSTSRGIDLYNRSEVCATNINDKAIRDRK